jgi:hypothetical protein
LKNHEKINKKTKNLEVGRFLSHPVLKAKPDA